MHPNLFPYVGSITPFQIKAGSIISAALMVLASFLASLVSISVMVHNTTEAKSTTSTFSLPQDSRKKALLLYNPTLKKL